MTKKVWRYDRTGGEYIGEWENEAKVQVPYTDVPPLEDVELEDQRFIPSKNVWKELINQLAQDELDNLSALYPLLQKENAELKANGEKLTQLNSKLMLNDVALKNENAALTEQNKTLTQLNSKLMLNDVQLEKRIVALENQAAPTKTIEGGN